MMKKAIVLLAFVFASSASAANLKSVMKAMGTDLKKIAAQVQNPALNASTLALAEDLMKYSVESRGMTPDVARKDLYIQLSDQVIAETQQLIDALRANDNAAAQAAAERLVQSKKLGHDEFKN